MIQSLLQETSPPNMIHGSALEVLQPELQQQVLLQVQTPKDLHAIMKASPRLFQVYSLNKERTLSTIARRQFHSATLPDALRLVKLAQMQRSLCSEEVRNLCGIDSAQISERQNAISLVSESVALCKLAECIKFFINDYARNTIPVMEERGRSLAHTVQPEYPPDDSHSCSRLSDSEHGRLQRAFCRFEVYRHLFAKCRPGFDHTLQACLQSPPLEPEEQARLYLGQLPDFQITEINCVRDYLFRRLRGICSALERQAMETLSPRDFVFDSQGCDVETSEWYSNVYIFTNTGKSHQDCYFEHLISLGLPYIRQLIEANGEKRMTLFTQDSYAQNGLIDHISKPKFITEAFECLEKTKNPASDGVELLRESDPPYVYEINLHGGLGTPDGWQWAHPRAPPFMLSDYDEKGLRDFGYVFWDLDRLSRSGMLAHDPEDVQRVDFDEFNASQGPSVQESLCGPPPYSWERSYGNKRIR